MIKRCVLTVSYGNYINGIGGTDKVIYTHQNILNQNSIHVLHVCKNNKLGKLNIYNWNVYFDGEFIGVFSSKRLLSYIFKLYKEEIVIETIFIHHMKNILISELITIVEYCKVPIIFYLHDYFTICPASGLIMDNGQFCGNNKPTYQKCSECVYYEKSLKLLPLVEEFFEKFANRITFIAPSDTAKNVWADSYPQYKDNVKVIYHQKFSGNFEGNSKIILDDEKLKIAFVGYQKPLKGWMQWKEGIKRAYDSRKKEMFFQFGWGNDKIKYCEQVEVDFKENLNAMTEALRKKEIHCAVIWSMWPETYAYTFYEAMAANTFIITNRLSGNVCAQVEKNNNGLVVDNLGDILCDEQYLRKVVNHYRESKHNVPLNLVENEDFLALINKSNWIPNKKSKVIDSSILFSLLFKFINRIKL